MSFGSKILNKSTDWISKIKWLVSSLQMLEILKEKKTMLLGNEWTNKF